MSVRPCRRNGCPAYAESGSSYCASHRPKDRRPSAARRGYNSKWRAIRARFLAAYPTCAAITATGRICGATATDVDHIVPLRQGGTNDWDNLQPLCHSHHSEKTDRHDGGFGREVG